MPPLDRVPLCLAAIAIGLALAIEHTVDHSEKFRFVYFVVYAAPYLGFFLLLYGPTLPFVSMLASFVALSCGLLWLELYDNPCSDAVVCGFWHLMIKPIVHSIALPIAAVTIFVIRSVIATRRKRRA